MVPPLSNQIIMGQLLSALELLTLMGVLQRYCDKWKSYHVFSVWTNESFLLNVPLSPSIYPPFPPGI